MADDADRARQLQQAEIERGITSRKPVPYLTPRGVCFDCGAPVGPKQLFCNTRCCEAFGSDWQAGNISHRDLYR